MKTLKKNNKGFSLVELIVVILIMAIIAVALAPQVMKWVDKSKESADSNNTAMLKSVMDAAVADFMTGNATLKAEEFYVVQGKGLYEEASGTNKWESESTGFDEIVEKTMNCADPDQLPKPQNGGTCFKITVTAEGGTTVSIYSPSGT